MKPAKHAIVTSSNIPPIPIHIITKRFDVIQRGLYASWMMNKRVTTP